MVRNIRGKPPSRPIPLLPRIENNPLYSRYFRFFIVLQQVMTRDCRANCVYGGMKSARLLNDPAQENRDPKENKTGPTFRLISWSTDKLEEETEQPEETSIEDNNYHWIVKIVNHN